LLRASHDLIVSGLHEFFSGENRANSLILTAQYNDEDEHDGDDAMLVGLVWWRCFMMDDI
jgi:hypothetical protein